MIQREHLDLNDYNMENIKISKTAAEFTTAANKVMSNLCYVGNMEACILHACCTQLIFCIQYSVYYPQCVQLPKRRTRCRSGVFQVKVSQNEERRHKTTNYSKRQPVRAKDSMKGVQEEMHKHAQTRPTSVNERTILLILRGNEFSMSESKGYG